MSEKSHVTLLVCPWCGGATGVGLDKRLRSVLPHETNDAEPCEACMKNAIILYDRTTKEHIGFLKKSVVLTEEGIENTKDTPLKAFAEILDNGDIDLYAEDGVNVVAQLRQS